MSELTNKNQKMGVYLFIVSFWAILFIVGEKVHHALIGGLGGF